MKSRVHPRGLITLSLCYSLFMWTFGYLVSALFLYFKAQLPNLSPALNPANTTLIKQHASTYTFIFLSLLWILPIVGGYVSQRIGYWQAALSGLVLCALGITGLTFHTDLSLVFFSLALFLVGNALFTPSLWCMVDHLYAKDDQRRESGFTLFYLIFNFGCVTGIFSENALRAHFDSYPLSFVLCIGTLIVTFLLLRYRRHCLDIAPERSIAPQIPTPTKLTLSLLSIGSLLLSGVITLLFKQPLITQILVYVISLFALFYCLKLAQAQPTPKAKAKVYGFTVLSVFAVGFWVLYNLEPSLLSVFIKDTVNRHLQVWGLGIKIPAESFFGFEGLSIIIIGLYLSNLWLRLAKKGKDPSLAIKFGLALVFISMGYLYLYAIVHLVGIGKKTPAFLVILSYLFFASGELCIGPLGISMVGKLSPVGKEGILMGIWQLVIGVSAIVANQISSTVIQKQHGLISEHTSYAHAFLHLGLIVIAAGIFVLLLSPWVKKLLGDK
jgi:proton-dependent oligopeptide transporter, POT family